MYYVLFNYTEGLRAKDFVGCRSGDDVIAFLHNHYDNIEVDLIIEAKAEYRLDLVVTKDYVKSVLEPKEETESLVPVEEERDKQILKRNKKTLEELEAGEPSAMSKIGDDIEKEMEEELTDEEKVEKAIEEGDKVIEREKERQKQKKKGWLLCTKCNSNRVAPWNKSQICSPCQNERKTNRPYSRSKEFSGL